MHIGVRGASKTNFRSMWGFLSQGGGEVSPNPNCLNQKNHQKWHKKSPIHKNAPLTLWCNIQNINMITMIVMCQTHRIFSNRSRLHSVSISQLRMTSTPSPSPSPCWSTVTPPPPSIHLAHLGAPFRYDQGSKYHSNNNDGDVSCLIL